MDEIQFEIRPLLGVLRRRFWLIVATMVLVLGVATVVTLALKPAFSASALVLVDTTRKDLLDPTNQATSASTDSARVDSEVELVKSATTLLRVIRDADLVHDPDFAYQVGWRDRILAFLKIRPVTLPSADEMLQIIQVKLEDSVRVQRRGLTYIISIEAKSDSPATAAKIANAVAAAYIQEQLEAKINGTLASRDIIAGRIDDAKAAIVTSEQAFDDFVSKNIDSVAADTGNTTIADLRNRLTSTSSEKARVKALLDSATTGAGNWDAVSEALKTDVITSLNARRKALQHSLDTATTGTATAVNLRDELTKINTDMNNAAASAVVDLDKQAASLRQQLQDTVVTSGLPKTILNTITELQQNTNITHSQYETLVQRQHDLDAKAYLQVPDSRIVSVATAPSSPSFPNTRLILALAAIAAAGIGIGLAFLYENFIGGFTSEEQLGAVLGVPVIASVPRQKAPKKVGDGSGSLADMLVQAPLSVYSEGIRRIRVGFDLSIRRQRTQNPQSSNRGSVVMITSTVPNEGKTTVALSLARAYALSGKTTLLIDCDLRKPSVHRHLGLEPSLGLVDYLTAHASAPELPSFLVSDPLSDVQVALGGRSSNIATDQLVTNKTFARLVESASSIFDVVVLDTPPIGPVVDGIYLAQYSDVIGFVVEWAHTSQQEVKKAVNSISVGKPTGVEVLLVLNQQSKSQTSSQYRYNSYYTE